MQPSPLALSIGSPRDRAWLTLRTALAPMAWGATYWVFTETLPTSHPLTVGALRSVPAGLLLLAFARPRLPRRGAWLRLGVLGLANIGMFSALLFVAAARLPGGTAATLISTQPLIATLVAWPALARRPSVAALGCALFGVVGVALLTSGADATDTLGVVAALGAALSMGTGTVLVKRWRGLAPPLSLAAWQLILGGLALAPVAFLLEGPPPPPTVTHLVGLALLVTVGTALTFALWILGVAVLGQDAAFLGLLSPLVAAAIGALLLDQWFCGEQLVGVALVLLAAVGGAALGRARTTGGES